MLGLWLQLNMQIAPDCVAQAGLTLWSQESLLIKSPKCWDDRYVASCQLGNLRFDERQGSAVLITSNSGDTKVLSILSSWTNSTSASPKHHEISALVSCSPLVPVCSHLTVGVSMKIVSP